MPESVYVSYNGKRSVENEFYFIMYKEHRCQADRTVRILRAPSVTVSGFEGLLKIPRQTKEQQDAQLKAAAEKLVHSLCVTADWSVDYYYESRTGKLSLVLTCVAQNLREDFSIKISAQNFICGSTDTAVPAILNVHTDGFAELFGDFAAYDDYYRTVSIYYAPCVTKLEGFMKGGGVCTERLFANPCENPLTISWQIEGNGRIEHTLEKNGYYIQRASAVNSVEDLVDADACYTLRASNQKGFSDWRQLRVTVTGWRKAGQAEDLLSDGDSLSDLAGIVRYQDSYYCYKKAVLYQSTDGCRWTGYSNNPLDDADRKACTAVGLYGDSLYLMTGKPGGRLTVMRYDFRAGKWMSAPAGQNCISMDGHLAFSKKGGCYGQTTACGMAVSGCDMENDWASWKEEQYDIMSDHQPAVCSDLCFWKDSYYAVIVAADGKYYVYKCSERVQEALAAGAAGSGPVRLLPTINRLMAVGNGWMSDLETKQAADQYFPPAGAGMCTGSDQTSVFGIFSDGSFWIYE